MCACTGRLCDSKNEEGRLLTNPCCLGESTFFPCFALEHYQNISWDEIKDFVEAYLRKLRTAFIHHAVRASKDPLGYKREDHNGRCRVASGRK